MELGEGKYNADQHRHHGLHGIYTGSASDGCEQNTGTASAGCEQYMGSASAGCKLGQHHVGQHK